MKKLQPQPGKGYRWLRTTETLRKTDEYKVNDGWRPTGWAGQRADDEWTYRRKIKPRKAPATPRLSTLIRRAKRIGAARDQSRIILQRMMRKDDALQKKLVAAWVTLRAARQALEES